MATLFAAPLAVPAIASAAPSIGNCVAQGSSLEANNGQCTDNTSGGTDNVNKLITNVINIFSVVVGVVSVIMIIFGGFRYITSGGDSNNISSAKNTIIYAIIGLVIVVFAQFIVQFVLNRLGPNATT
jgi:cytochrome bd-type quinol oxidase subunit 2